MLKLIHQNSKSTKKVHNISTMNKKCETKFKEFIDLSRKVPTNF